MFCSADGDVSEMRDNSGSGHPLVVDGVELIDGTVFGYRGKRWLAAREDLDGMVRFLWTVAEEDQPGVSSMLSS